MHYRRAPGQSGVSPVVWNNSNPNWPLLPNTGIVKEYHHWAISQITSKGYTGRLHESLAWTILSIPQKRYIHCLLKLTWHAFGLMALLRSQKPTNITIYLQYYPIKSFNSYCEVSSCLLCLLTIIPVSATASNILWHYFFSEYGKHTNKLEDSGINFMMFGS